MQFPISGAKAHLADLVRRAEAGDEVILTRHGHPVVRLAPVPLPSAQERKASLERSHVSWKAAPGPDAARGKELLDSGAESPK